MNGPPVKERKKLILFDFDGTLTRKDTLFEILKFIYGKHKLYLNLFLAGPVLLLFKMKIISAKKAKESIFARLLKGESSFVFQQHCNRFVSKKLPDLLRKEAMDTIMGFREEGADIFIVSASLENWIEPWCTMNNWGCIATKLEVKSGKLTGKLSGKNCNGIEKVSRILETIDLNRYEDIYAYGDSRGDLPMLKLARKNKRYYRFFI